MATYYVVDEKQKVSSIGGLFVGPLVLLNAETVNESDVFDNQSNVNTVIDTSNFNGNLSSADNTVQKALDTIDDLTFSGAAHSHSNKVILDSITASYTLEEKEKLANIEENAKNDQTGQEIVQAINTELGSTVWQTSGANGSDGADGVDGLSAYEVAVNNGFVGDEAAWLASLVGEAGADGADGANGSDGADGVGISNVTINGSNHLIVTLTDTSTVDAGLLPSGSGIDGVTSDPAAVTVDRGLILGLYDHTVPASDSGAPPPAAVFRSTVDGKVYQRLANGSTELLNNTAAEYGGGSSGGAGWGISVGAYYFGGHVKYGVGTGELEIGLSQLFAVPISLDDTGTWTRIGIMIGDNSPVGSGAQIRLGIYANENQFPTSLLLNAGAVDVDSTGAKEIVINQALPAGKYWLTAMSTQSGVLVIANSYGRDRGQILPAAPAPDWPTVTHYSHNIGSVSALPQTYPIAAIPKVDESPRIWLRSV